MTAAWLLAFGTVAATIAAAEGICRWHDARSRRTRTHVVRWGRLRAIRLEEARPGRRMHWVPSGEFLEHSGGYLERRPYSYDVDRDGFLAPSAVHDKPRRSIVFQGGSTTEIVFVEPERRFPYLAGRLIEQRTGESVNAYNAGSSGSHTLDSINALLNKHAAMRPSFVVMMEAVNDLNTLILNHNSYYGKVRRTIQDVEPRRGRRDPSLRAATSHLADSLALTFVPHLRSRAAGFAAALRKSVDDDEFASVRDEPRTVDADTIRCAFRRNLVIYITAAKALGITPVLMTQPNRFDDPSPDWQAHLSAAIESRIRMPFADYRSLYASLNDVTRSVGRDEDVFVIDLAGRIPARAAFMHDAVHFNERGSTLAAEIISEALVARYF